MDRAEILMWKGRGIEVDGFVFYEADEERTTHSKLLTINTVLAGANANVLFGPSYVITRGKPHLPSHLVEEEFTNPLREYSFQRGIYVRKEDVHTLKDAPTFLRSLREGLDDMHRMSLEKEAEKTRV